MAENLFFDRWLKRCALILLVVFGASLPACEGCPAQPPDTLDLQLQWSYPLAIVDMKLVDFDGDGINEILVGFNSDSARVGVLSAVTQSMVWQSPGLHGSVLTVGAGDRDAAGSVDVVCGGQCSDSLAGYIQVFDGPDFRNTHFLAGFDKCVVSTAISARCLDSLPKVLVGTMRDTAYVVEGLYNPIDVYERFGSLFILDGQELTVENSSRHGTVREISLFDADGDSYDDVFLGMDEHTSQKEQGVPVSLIDWRSSVAESTRTSSRRWTLQRLTDWDALGGSLRGMEVTRDNDTYSVLIFACSDAMSGPNVPCWTGKLSCWNESTGDFEWGESDTHCMGEPGQGNTRTDITVCRLGHRATEALCVLRGNGLLEFRSVSDGSELVSR